MKIWIDDLRPAPDGWVHVKTAAEAIELLNNNVVKEISLDNDLGDGQPEGYIVLDYIEERLARAIMLPPEKIHIHTGNPVARKRMTQTLESINRFMAVLKNCLEEGLG